MSDADSIVGRNIDAAQGEAGAAEGGGVMAGVDNASKILGAFQQLAGAVESIQTLIGIFSGEKSGPALVAEALHELTAALEKGLGDIKKAIVQQTLSERWQGYSDQLQEWSTTIKIRLNELKSIDPTTHRMTFSGDDLTIAQWCEGKNEDGVLHELGHVLGRLSAWLTAGDDKSSPIDLWEQVAGEGALSGEMGEGGESLYTQLLAWQQSLYVMVQSAVYIRNAALLLYLKSGVPIKYGNLDSTLKVLGSSADPDSTWGAIEEKLEKYRKVSVEQDRGICARASCDDTSPPEPAETGLVEAEFRDGEEFLAKVVLEAETSLDNGYFAGLELAFVDMASPFQPFHPVEHTRYWFLRGTRVTLAQDGTRTIDTGFTSLNAAIQQGKFPGDLELVEVGPDLSFGMGRIDQTKLQIPAGSSAVVRGFKLVRKGASVVIALQYGAFKMGDDGVASVSPADPAFVSPATVTGTIRAADLRKFDLGIAGTGSNVPLTDASFMQNGSNLSLLARSAWTGYQADRFQPCHLKQFSPKVDDTKPHQVSATMPPAT